MAITRLLMKKGVISLFTYLLSSVNANPLPSDEHPALYRRSDLDIIATTTTPSGQVIDWIPIASQGDINNIIPEGLLSLDSELDEFTGQGAQSELLLPGVELGPPGTVPIPRMSKAYLDSDHNKQGLPDLQSSKTTTSKRQTNYQGQHWYVNSGQSVVNLGGSAFYSLFKAFTQSTSDFSLIQTAVVRTNAQSPGNPSATTLQTLEAGWINYPAQIAQPHVFTYYTTVDYTAEGDYVGGWNTEHKGWVQLSSTYYPGVVLTPLSTIGGTQDEINLNYRLSNGRWYLQISGTNIKSQFMGYYPAALFSNHTVTSGPITLANSSDTIAYYGEIYNSETALTTTDMGSGKFPNTGYKNSGYIHNMIYFDQKNTSTTYTAGFGDSDSTRYTHNTTVAPGASSWASYVYLGGPGAGGVTGG